MKHEITSGFDGIFLASLLVEFPSHSNIKSQVVDFTILDNLLGNQ